jgi:hypothetical protein
MKLSAFHDYMNMPKKFYVNEHQYKEDFSWMQWKSIPQLNNIQSLNMMDLVLRCNKFYEKQDIEMGFAATCLSTGKVFICALEGLSVPSVHNTEEVQMVRCWIFWDVMHFMLVVTYWRFGTIFQPHLQGSSTQRRIVRLDSTEFVAMFVKAFPEWLAMVVSIWELESTALWTSGADNLIKRAAHCTSEVRTSSCDYEFIDVALWLVTQSHSPLFTNPPPTLLLHVPITLKYHCHITSSLISIHNLSRLVLSKLCSSEKYLLRGHCMVAREISLFRLNYFIYHTTCKCPLYFIIYLCWRHGVWLTNW